MPVKSPSKERPLIELFLSAYEKGDWSPGRWPEEEQDGAVEVIARKSDNTKPAIEHTLIQLFVREKEDFSRFVEYFSRIEKSPAFVVPARNLVVFIPVRSLAKGYNWEGIGEDLRSWLLANHTDMLVGYSEHSVPVGVASKKGTMTLRVGIQVSTHPGMSGCCLIAPSDRVPADLRNDVERALTKKLPKLDEAHADKRILLLERDQIRPDTPN